MNEEANMGRRPITRADEGEVRRRVEQCGGASDRLRLIDQRGGIVLAVDRPGERWFIPADQGEAARLATVGIFPGPDGWVIEVAPPVDARRKLPAPWRWFEDVGSMKLAKSQADVDDVDWIAGAYERAFLVYDGTKLVCEDKATSLADARERAEDECWARGLFGVSNAPPVASTPVDRTQAIRDALIDALAEGWSDETDLRAALLNRDIGSIMSETLWRALASIGAVKDGHRWRLSDGPPPGWEWRRQGDLAWYLAPVGHPNPRAGYIGYVPPGERAWHAFGPGIDGCELAQGEGASGDECKAAALHACRRAGLFAAVEQATEDPAFPTDAGVARDPLPLSEPSADPAARMLLRMFSVATGIGIDGTREGHPDTTPTQRIQQVGRLCDSFVAEMRAGRREDQRIGSAVLVDYLTEHHADTWRANESAATFAVRLLRSADDTIDAMTAELDRTKVERVSADRERDEAIVARTRAQGERHDARAERDRFERLHAAAEATAGEIEGELDVARAKLARALDDAAAMVAHAGRLEQFLSGKVAS